MFQRYAYDFAGTTAERLKWICRYYLAKEKELTSVEAMVKKVEKNELFLRFKKSTCLFTTEVSK
ncbi:MAG: hypothetical protein P4M11_04290 [Candidatus Pacebacteria bacterium]|nr:hypothetical protein [Candidatus Paceibacterota bacterium]